MDNPANLESGAERRTALKSARTLVVKVGSAVLTTASGELDMPVLESLCGELADIRSHGVRVVLVSSGAVAAGRGVLGVRDPKPTIAVKQALAAVGQTRLMEIYAGLFARRGIVVGQMLLARSDMEDRRRYVNARYTLEELLDRGCLPIINENDTVTVDELRFGDNDGLAAIVAVKMQARSLILLSDVDGLFDDNPKTNPDARMLDHVTRITPELLAATRSNGVVGKGLQIGTGGMATKLLAARMAMAAGVTTVIAPGKRPGVLAALLEGGEIGTCFPGREIHRSRRAQWILSGKAAGRRLVVDNGARKALFRDKKSLLPAGIRRVEGEFHAQDFVEIADEAGELLGRGIVNYGSAELNRILGRKTSEIEKILGAKTYDEAIHRDNMALIEPDSWT